MKKYISEFLGTLTLVLFGCGIAVVSKGDLVATSLAFGLAIVASAYAIGDISGCHVNPAVSLSMFITGKMKKRDFIAYVIAQVLGALAGSALLYLILSSTTFGTDNLGANGYGYLSASHISLIGAAITEIVLTFIFVFTILGVTKDDSKSAVTGIVIGLTLTFVHLLGIGLTGTSVNPARSLAPALFVGGHALKQVWVFILFPLLGSALASCTFKFLEESKMKKGRK